MVVTLLDLVRRVSRKVGLNPAISEFSEHDESQDVVQDILEAYEELLLKLPESVPFLSDTGTLVTVEGIRLYTPDGELGALVEHSFVNNTLSSAPLRFATLEKVSALDPLYASATGVPAYVYREQDQVGIYPVPDDVYTLTYRYGRFPERVSLPGDSLLLPDRWLNYIERRAQAEYEKRKGFSRAERSEQQAYELLAEILIEADLESPSCFYSEGF